MPSAFRTASPPPTPDRSVRVLHLAFTDGTSGVAEHARRFRELLGASACPQGSIVIGNPFEGSWPEGRALPRLLGGIRAIRAGWDVLHAELSNASAREYWLLHLLMARLPDLPVVLTVHDSPRLCRFPFAPLFHGSGARSLPLRLVRKALDDSVGRSAEWWMKRHTEIAMVTTCRGASRLRRTMPWARVVHVPLPAPRVPRRETAVATPGRPVHLLFFGHLKPAKGVDLALRAFGELCRDRTVEPETRLLLCGPVSPRYRRQLGELATLVGVAGRVGFLGYVEQERLPELFGGTLAAVFPYRRIPTSSASAALLRCLSSGLAVVVSDGDRLARQITDGVDGLLFRENDAGDLAAKLRLVCRDAALRGRLAAGALRRTATTHDGERIARIVADLYAVAAGRSPSRAGGR